MTWDDLPEDASPTFETMFVSHEPEVEPRDASIELVGTSLRVRCVISLGRFPRLTDLIGSTSGFIRVRDAQLLAADGSPTGEVLPLLMVDQDAITFIAEPDAPLHEPGSGSPPDDLGVGGSLVDRRTRRFALFTDGHELSGSVFLFGETDLAAFVESTHPRFIPLTDVTVRSLADHGRLNRYPFVLINRTKLLAAAELDGGADPGGGSVW
jgi:hypothetical protein